jgi:hypothetical protein
MKCIWLAAAVVLAQAQPSLTLKAASANVSITGGGIAGSYAFDRVGSLAAWGPRSGGLLEIQNEAGETFQFTAPPKPGKYKTSVGAPLVVQLGKGPQVKVVKSAAGECTVTVAQAADAGINGTFDCRSIPIAGPENKQVGAIEAMKGSFSASR